MTAAGVDGEFVRSLGNLPESVTDELLAPHIDGAKRKVGALLGGRVPSGATEEDRAAEAVGCFAIAYALPVLNTFYLSQAERLPRTAAQTDYVFHEPGETLKLAQYWTSRAYDALREVGRAGGTVGVTVV